MTTKELALTAAQARALGLDMVYGAASGHIGGSLSSMDILTVLYQNVMNIDPSDPQKADRDRFVLSKGHCTPALYPTLALRGYFPLKDLKMFRSIDGHMSGHAEMHHVKGVDMSTGSLGQGQPTVILAATVKGKGVSFMENNAGWHGKAPNAEQYEQARAELAAKIAELEVQ